MIQFLSRMDDMKDKMKGFMKKVTSSSSGKFKLSEKRRENPRQKGENRRFERKDEHLAKNRARKHAAGERRSERRKGESATDAGRSMDFGSFAE